MKKIIISLLVMGLIVYLVSTNINTNSKNENLNLEKIVYGTAPVTIDSLFHIAYKKEYFKEFGIDVEMQLNPDGKTSLKNLFNNKADIVAVAGIPIIYNSFIRDDFVIIADIKHTDIHKAIGRKSSGIQNANDLVGKKVAVMKGTSAEFFMDQYFAFNKINMDDVTLAKSLNAPQKLQAFLDNKIDAFFCWEPFISKAKKALGDGAVILKNEDVFIGSWLIVVKKEFLSKNRKVVINFLKALHKAEEMIKNHRDEAIKIHSEVVGIDIDIAKALFSKNGYKIKLDQSLLILLEDQARWAIDYKYVKSSKVPNYLNFIDTTLLKEIHPEDMTIIEGGK